MPPKKRKTTATKDEIAPVKKVKPDDGKGEQSEPQSSKYWLMKSESESRYMKGVDVKFSIDDLQKEPQQTACWDGVRNHEARNHMSSMKVGDKAFFYHSNCKKPGIVGIVEIVREAYPDHTQFDENEPHYDWKSKKDDPRWIMVDVKFVRLLKRFIPMTELKKLHADHVAKGDGELSTMKLFTRSRLSVQPVSQQEFSYILGLEEQGVEQ